MRSMNMTWIASLLSQKGRLIARFGGASLIKQPDGHYELRGGTAVDQTEAKEWVSLFMHEAAPVFRRDILRCK